MLKDGKNSFGARSALQVRGGSVNYFDLGKLADAVGTGIDRLPFSVKVLLENVLRNEDGCLVTRDDVVAVTQWRAGRTGEVAFMPARVLLQDFTGVPSVVDLAALRDAMKRLGGDPKRITPQIPVDMVIDHSVQVDHFGSEAAFRRNVEREYERNRERYTFLRWGQENCDNFRVVPPDTGIVHQINLEYLARVVCTRTGENGRLAFPDSLVGTDSHTTMVNGIGVFGWGVGGIEAEAVMLGQPYYMLAPQVVGFRLKGSLPPGATASDLVLTVTERLRGHGVVGKFVEFCGPGLSGLSLADRATIANMAPEYGATMGFFPVDDGTLDYLRLSGRDPDQVALVEAYCKQQGLFRTGDGVEPEFAETLEFDMGAVVPCLAGPKRPQDRIPLRDMKERFRDALAKTYGCRVPAPEEGAGPVAEPLSGRTGSYGESAVQVVVDREEFKLAHGSVVIAAITSCTNTSNPSVMLGAGLLAKKAVERGLRVPPWVKTSLAPGSKVVTDYLRAAGLLPALETLRFHLVGYGCTTCIGNSGPLAAPIARAIRDGGLVVAGVLSGNRNFEGRINPHTRANYLASPPLVVAYALAGTVDIDMRREPLGQGRAGRPVYLHEIWPSREEIEEVIRSTIRPAMFERQYGRVFDGDEQWRSLPVPEGELYGWDPASTYIRSPPFFETTTRELPPLGGIENARVLALLGDSVTTDHISPAGAIPADSPAARYLIDHDVAPRDFNSFGSRRGNHEVMMRGTFGNVRLRNQLVAGVEGGWTCHLPDGERMSIYDAAMRYREEKVPLLVIGGKEYGTGSSRDWAAKGTVLLGVRAVIAESFERIHRGNLVGMGVLPLQFKDGENATILGLTGRETYRISGISAEMEPGMELPVQAAGDEGREVAFGVIVRLDAPVDIEYYKNGGILPAVLRSMVASE